MTRARPQARAPAILPGSTLGILGSGQLGRMLAFEAKRMGYRVHVYSPGQDTPAGQLADLEVTAPYDDTDALAAFAKGVDVVTLEFENIPARALEHAARYAPVRPGPGVLFAAQHRLREKTTLQRHGFPVVPFCLIRDRADLEPALATLGTPAVLKTVGFGYDGKGQVRVTSLEGAERALAELAQEGVLEAFVPFERELSVVAARGTDGSIIHYGVIENRHQNHILDVSFTPPDLPAEITNQATEMALAVLAVLSVVGVMCVEFFLTPEHTLLINEVAPRPHNSGHLTLDACTMSQFEAQLCAVCALPLVAPRFVGAAATANLLGDVWTHGAPDWAAALALDVRLHLYGKTEARPGRKMGHLTAVADSAPEAVQRVLAARAGLRHTP